MIIMEKNENDTSLIYSQYGIISQLISGITNFDLLGSFGKMKWLGNFYIVLLYNAIFAFSASLSLFNKLTSRVRQEIVSRYVYLLMTHYPKNT